VIVLELTIIGAYNYEASGFAPALELLASGALPVDALIEPDDVLLDELLPTMRRLAAGELAGKVMVRPDVATIAEVATTEVPA
jgi:threonine dehydrogenase-like Zn-dependent dehydrogenase